MVAQRQQELFKIGGCRKIAMHQNNGGIMGDTAKKNVRLEAVGRDHF
jgi:hypothetical protein